MGDYKKKFHVNNEGRVMPCNAQPGNCPFGDETTHFDSFKEALTYADKVNSAIPDQNSAKKTPEDIRAESLITEMKRREEFLNRGEWSHDVKFCVSFNPAHGMGIVRSDKPFARPELGEFRGFGHIIDVQAELEDELWWYFSKYKGSTNSQ